MSRDLASATSLETVARVTAQTVNQLLGASHLSLALKATNPALISLQVINPAADQSLGAAQLMPTENTLTGETLKKGVTRYAPDLTQLARQYQDVAELSNLGMRSLVSLHLKAGSQSVGQLNVGSEQLAAYTDDHVRQLEQIAAQMAVAIESYNLAQQTRQALDELDATNRRLVGQAWERYTRSSDTLAGEWREGQWLTTQTAHVAAPDGHDLLVPLQVRGETIGEFSVQTNDQRVWTADDVAFAQALIDQVGQVIENARLLEETERFAQREQRIRQITNRIRAASDVQAVLQTTTTELARSLGVSRAIMRLTMGEADVTGEQPRASHETAA
jgi:GAF domain-containing protein